MNPFHPTQSSIKAPVVQKSDAEGANRHGRIQQFNLDHGKVTTVIRYKDQVIEADVYRLAGAPIKVVFRCPRCGSDSTINGDQKAVEFTDHEPRRVFTDAGDVFMSAGELSVEPFQCPWEMPDAGAHVPGLVSGGVSLCKLTLGIEKGVARDA